MKILEITSELDGGGVDRLLFDYCSRMIPDIQFDFIVTSKTEGMLEKPLRDLGCNVFHISQIRENRKLYTEQLKEILKNGHYDVVHDHSGYKAIFTMYYAKKYGVKGRISHSHIAYIPERFINKVERKLLTPITASLATNLYACGIDAAKWMWGKKKYNDGKVSIMTNAIKADSFIYSEKERTLVRAELGIENKFVIGNVARFSYQKNHDLLIRVFKKVLEIREDAILLLIGRGELYSEIVELTKEMKLTDKIIFLGVRNDVHRLLNAMDLFMLPSRYEGLPVTLVEVQANGLAALVSDSVTDEVKLADNVKYMSLSAGEEQWAQNCCLLDTKRLENAIKGSNYDLEFASSNMKRNYEIIAGFK
jgi:glycosyltransferase involved in cell wall biosynthesis